MGPCASIQHDGSRTKLPLAYQVPEDKQKIFSNRVNELELQLSNVAITPSPTPEIDISFAITGMEVITMQKSNKITQRLEDQQCYQSAFEIKWQQINKVQLSLSDTQLVESYLSVYLSEKSSARIEVVKISLYLIVNGPYHHNILIPFGKQPRRIVFDAKISHIFEINARVEHLKLHLSRSLPTPLSRCRFTLKTIRQEEVIADSPQSYPTDPKNLNFSQLNQQNYFQQQRPKLSEIQAIHKSFEETQQSNLLSWGNHNQANQANQSKMPEVTFDSSTLQISSYSIQIAVWSQIERKSQYVCQVNIPLWKLLDKQYIKEKKNRKDTLGNLVSLQDRVLAMTERVYCQQDIIGSCEIKLRILNEKLIQQSKYSSRTEEGVLNLRPSTFSKTIKSNSKTIHQIWKLSDKIDKTVKQQGINSNIQQVEAQIQSILEQIYDILKTTLNEVLYSDADNCDALLNNQQIFISLMTKLSPFTEDAQNSSLSQISWAILIGFLKRRQFSLQNLSLKGINKTLQSQHPILLKKREIGLKYQQVIYKLITNALKCYGLYSSNNSMLSRFLSFCYFRVPIFREYFLQVMDFQNKYAQMENKLLVFQTEIEPKTSFGSSFADIKGNWKSNFYDQLQQIPKSKQLAAQLFSSFKSKKFFIEICYKDETLDHFFTLLFRCLSNDSSEKSDKWKYIQGYSKIVAIILTELKQKLVTKYRPSLIRLSVGLLQNQYLIGSMLPLVCDQTNLHDIEKVQIALDLIQEYFQAATKKKQKQMPSTFNGNYLLKVLRIILEGENCYAINRFLVIIYHFFDQLASGLKLQLAMYFTGKVFFKLFYHWSSEVRYTFYLIFIVKIQHINHPRSSQLKAHLTKILSVTKALYQIYERNQRKTQFAGSQVLYKKMRIKIQDKFKEKQSLSSSSNHKKQYSLQNLYKMLEEVSILPQLSSTPDFVKSKGGFELTPSKNSKYMESQQFDLQAPTKSQRSFSDKIPIPEQILMRKNTISSMAELQPKKLQPGRKKRRPSVFLEGLVSPNPNTQIIRKISNQLQQLSELKQQEIRNIGISNIHFEEVNQLISKYRQKNGGAFPDDNFINIKKNLPTC